MSLDLTSIPGWDVVRALLAELRSQVTLFETFALGQIETLDGRTLAIERRELEVSRQSEQLRRQRAELEQGWQKLCSLRDQAAHELRAAKRQAQQLATDSSQLQGNAAPAGELATFAGGPSTAADARVEKLEQELEQARSSLARLVDSAAQLNAARREVDRLRRRLFKQNARLARVQGQLDREQVRSAQCHANDRLATELSGLAEQSKSAAQQGRHERALAARERRSWLGEVRRLRQAVEKRCLEPAAPGDWITSRPPDPLEIECLDALLNEFDELRSELHPLVTDSDPATAG